MSDSPLTIVIFDAMESLGIVDISIEDARVIASRVEDHLARAALAASPAPASRPEAEHSHETGGAWHVTRWRVPGCPACGDPSPASRPEAVVKAEAWDEGWDAREVDKDDMAPHGLRGANPYRAASLTTDLEAGENHG